MKINLIWRAGDLEKVNTLFVDTQVKAKRLTGRGGLFDRFLQVIPDFIKKNFDSLGSRLGWTWQPLTPAYAKAKAIKYPGNPILVASGHLRLGATLLNAPGNFVYWSGNTMLYGVDPTQYRGSYPIYHQYGTSKMSARPFMGLANEDLETLVKITTDYMQPPEGAK
jgi:phage gpG-like protein